MAEMRILNEKGDARVAWDPTDEKSVEEVRVQFDELIANGWMAFDVQTDEIAGTSGSVTRKFNPDAETIIVSRPLVGG